MTGLLADGFAVYPAEAATRTWVDAAAPAAEAALQDPALADWYQCENTWFVGLDALPNDSVGRLNGSGPLTGAAMAAAQALVGAAPPLHPAQLSVTFPGYPKPRAGETEAAFRYRLNRDAAHVDGVIGKGSPKRRFVEEPHAYILGVALNDADPHSAPLVAWRGSHRIMHAAFARAFQDVPRSARAHHDLTDIYVAARKAVFDSCERVALPLKRAEAVLLHPFTLHGVAPWGGGQGDRRIAYVRPELDGGIDAWLALPID